MRLGFEGAGEALRSPIPWVALTAALALTAAGWIGLERNRSDEARAQFERRTETAEAAIRSRMLSYEQVLRSGAARIASSPLDLAPGVARLHRAPRARGALPRHPVDRLRRARESRGPRRAREAHALRRLPRLRDPPAGRARRRFPAVFNEPFVGRNARVIGFDMYSEPTRRAAMERARDNVDVAISGKVMLAGEAFRGTQAQQPGFVMYVPVFYKEVRTLGRATSATRRSPGFVFSPFRMHDLMRGILDEGVLQVLDMQVFDDAEARSRIRAHRHAHRLARDALRPGAHLLAPGELPDAGTHVDDPVRLAPRVRRDAAARAPVGRAGRGNPRERGPLLPHDGARRRRGTARTTCRCAIR